MIKIGKITETDWIDTVVNEVLSKTGTLRPQQGGKPAGAEGDREWQRAIDSGYNPTDVYFQMFDESNLIARIPNFHTCGRQRHWWLTKMMPGNFMPMHVDPHTEQQDNADRFWIPLQDWQPGHIFMYENIVVTDYKKGDIYKYTDSTALHGAANIGFTPRIVLQITLHGNYESNNRSN